MLWEESQIWYGNIAWWHRCSFPISYTCIQLVSQFFLCLGLILFLCHISVWTFSTHWESHRNNCTGTLRLFFMPTHAFLLLNQQGRQLVQFCRTLLIQGFYLRYWCVSTRFAQLDDSLHYDNNYIRLENHKLSVEVHSLSNPDTSLICSVKQVSIIVIYQHTLCSTCTFNRFIHRCVSILYCESVFLVICEHTLGSTRTV